MRIKDKEESDIEIIFKGMSATSFRPPLGLSSLTKGGCIFPNCDFEDNGVLTICAVVLITPAPALCTRARSEDRYRGESGFGDYARNDGRGGDIRLKNLME